MSVSVWLGKEKSLTFVAHMPFNVCFTIQAKKSRYCVLSHLSLQHIYDVNRRRPKDREPPEFFEISSLLLRHLHHTQWSLFVRAICKTSDADSSLNVCLHTMRCLRR